MSQFEEDRDSYTIEGAINSLARATRRQRLVEQQQRQEEVLALAKHPRNRIAGMLRAFANWLELTK